MSLMVPLAEGDLVEVGMVGRDGMAGLPVLLDANSAPTEAQVQVPGFGWRMRADALREVRDRNPHVRMVLNRYLMAFHSQITQIAVCNARHTINERLARWLLMAHDRCDGDQMPLTQEAISIMLGVRRPGVTVAAGALQKKGLIGYQQGRITILDRPGSRGCLLRVLPIIREQSGGEPTAKA